VKAAALSVLAALVERARTRDLDRRVEWIG